MRDAGAFLFYGVVLDDAATLKHHLWSALKPELGPDEDEEAAFYEANTIEILSAYCATHKCAAVQIDVQ